ncbi:MAG: carbamoyl-phosphate synthase large subunit, partial [Gammaproteobacteria bacterium]|nr:carbamoyl-phosphate synthase large subunit [Gammaproteobacteria bacterium]
MPGSAKPRYSIFADAAARTRRALAEFRIEGVRTNIPFLMNVLAHEDFAAGRTHTRWVEENAAALAVPPEGLRPRFAAGAAEANGGDGFAGARVDTTDPLALFDHDRAVKAAQAGRDRPEPPEPDGLAGVASPIQGTIVALLVAEGDTVLSGQPVAVVEAMKMEHEVRAGRAGVVRRVTMNRGDVVREGWPIAFVEPAEVEGDFA